MPARRQPSPGVSARAVLAALAIMAGTLVAHSWAGGSVPSPLYLAGATVLVFGGTLAVFQGRTSVVPTAVVLAGGQFALHVLLTAMSAGSAHDLHHANDGMSAMHAASGLGLLSMGWQMAAAHALSAVLTVVVWSVTARALHEIAHLPHQPVLAVDIRARRISGSRVLARPLAPLRWSAPRRGPPRGLLPRCA